MMMIPSPPQARAAFARSLLCLACVLIFTGTIVQVAAAPHNRRSGMAGLQNRAEEIHDRPSRTLKQFDPRNPKPQRVRRAGHIRPSHRPGQDGNNGDGNNGNSDHTGSNDDDGNSGDGDDDDNNNSDDDNGAIGTQNDDDDDDVRDGPNKKKEKDS